MAEREWPSGGTTPRKADKQKPDKQKPDVEPLTKAKVKGGLGKKMKEAFVGDNTKNIGEYVLLDVILPTIKDLISNTVREALDTSLYGHNGRSNRRYNSGRSNYEPYGYRNRPQSGGSVRSSTRYNSPNDRFDNSRFDDHSRRNHDFTDIVIADRNTTVHVFEKLQRIIDDYDECTVANFYTMVGLTPDITDEYYGWRDISRTSIRRVRDGWVLDLPQPIDIR